MKRVDGFRNLYSRGGTFVVRVQVPERERQRVGARELKQSLGGDFAVAKKRYPAVWADLLARIAPTGSDAAAQAPHVPSELEIDAAVRQYHSALRPNIALAGPNADGTTGSRGEQLAALTASAVWQAGNNNSTAMALQARWLCEEHGWDIPEASPLFKEISTKLLRARLDRLRQEKHKANALFGPRDDADPMFSEGAGASSADAKARTIGQLIALFRTVQEPTLAPSTKKGYRISLRALEEILGADFPLKNLNRQRCREVRDTLAGLPSNYRKLPETRDLSLKEAVEAGHKLGLPKVKPATLNGYVNKLRALLELAVDEEWIPTNPATRLTVPDPVSPAEKRHSFSTPQLRQIFFGEPWSSANRNVSGRPARFWLPLLALYTGARVGELAQLAVADVSKVTDVDVINIRATVETRLKNRNAERRIPVHPELISLGFLQFVDDARLSGRDRLFPEEPMDAHQHYGRGVSDWFARLLDKRGMTDPKLTFHSFRHNFEDALREANLHGTPKAAYLTGRAGGGVAANYGGGYSASALRDAIALVNYPDLDLTWLHVNGSTAPPPPP